MHGMHRTRHRGRQTHGETINGKTTHKKQKHCVRTACFYLKFDSHETSAKSLFAVRFAVLCICVLFILR